MFSTIQRRGDFWIEHDHTDRKRKIHLFFYWKTTRKTTRKDVLLELSHDGEVALLTLAMIQYDTCETELSIYARSWVWR